MPRRRLVRNAARCLACGDLVESRDEDDVGVCSCGSLCVAGGLDDPHISFEARAGAGWEDASVILEVLPGGGQAELELGTPPPATGGAASDEPAGDGGDDA